MLCETAELHPRTDTSRNSRISTIEREKLVEMCQMENVVCYVFMFQVPVGYHET